VNRYAELIDQLKHKKKLETDYQVAKLLHLDNKIIYAVRAGKRPLDLYAITRIATELNLDPMTLLADLHKDLEKNEVKRGFWRDFFYAATHTKAVLAVLTLTAFCAIASGIGETRANPLTEKTLYERRRLLWLLGEAHP